MEIRLLSISLAAIVLLSVLRAPAVAASAVGGKDVFDPSCAACHGVGVAGAPKLDDKASLAARGAAGKSALHAAAIKGKGAMPPKGAMPACRTPK